MALYGFFWENASIDITLNQMSIRAEREGSSLGSGYFGSQQYSRFQSSIDRWIVMQRVVRIVVAYTETSVRWRRLNI